MSAVDDVRAAKTPRDAMLALARRIDLLEQGHGEWDTWGIEETGSEVRSDGKLSTGYEAINPDATPEQQRLARELIDWQREHGAELDANHAAANSASTNTDPREIVLPPPSPEKMKRREMFAKQQLRLDPELTAAYVKGGPLWFYNFDLEQFMSYDYPARQLMVADLEEDDPAAAYQMSLHALKQAATVPDIELK